MSGLQVGDVVVVAIGGYLECSTASHTGEDSPPVGSVRRIVDFMSEREDGCPCDCVSANFADGTGAVLQRLRKIRPASDEFIEALRACKPERIGEPSNV